MTHEQYDQLLLFIPQPFLKFLKLKHTTNNVMMPDSLRNGTEARNGTGTVPYMTVSDYVQRFKSLTTIAYIDGVKSGDSHLFDKRVWQKSYHDHIIRNEQEYQEIWEYIDTNPLKWQDDECFAL